MMLLLRIVTVHIGSIHKEHHSFRTYAKFSKKLIFLTPDTRTYVCVSGVKKC